jgi:short-subunit dehydrogenase
MKTLVDKVIIITGGGKGIGRETAKLLAKNQAVVVITGRSEKELAETCSYIKEQDGRCEYYVGDVTSIDDCQRIVASVIEKHQRIDALINNAGMSMRGLFEDTDLALFHKIIDINFTGAVNMTKMALDKLIESRGSILFISSLSALKGIPGIAPYGTAKMALTGFSESLRAELYDRHVHVGIIYVGFTENDPNKHIYSATGELMPLHRDKNSDTQTGVAKSVLKSLRKRRPVMYLTCAGKIANVVYRLFPRLSSFLLRKFSLKSSRYK